MADTTDLQTPEKTPSGGGGRVKNLIRMFSHDKLSSPTAGTGSPTKSVSPSPRGVSRSPQPATVSEEQPQQQPPPAFDVQSHASPAPASADTNPPPPTTQPAATTTTVTTASMSSLSAAAPTFSLPVPASSPQPPPPDASTTDLFASPTDGEPFAQTGAAQDDLFDDLVAVPGQGEMRVRSEDDLFSEDFTPAKQVVVEEEVVPAAPRGPRGRGRGSGWVGGERGRGRGRGRGEGGRGRGRGEGRGRGRGGSSAAATAAVGVETKVGDTVVEKTEEQEQQILADREIHDQEQAAPPENAPTGPKADTPSTTTPATATVPAVRGDRLKTGGVTKPKLTPEELDARIANIKLKNASLTAAHARAEADAQSFAEREEVARQQTLQKQQEETQRQKEAAQQQREDRERQKRERGNRQQMMGEREKNRMRKLQAMGGREWDVEKEEGDFQKGGKFDGKGFAGDQEGYSDGREYMWREPRGGRGDRGRGRGRGGGGRGGREAAQPPRQEDFPSLPAANKSAPAADSAQVAQEMSAQAGGEKSWADQVESSNTA